MGRIIIRLSHGCLDTRLSVMNSITDGVLWLMVVMKLLFYLVHRRMDHTVSTVHTIIMQSIFVNLLKKAFACIF